jgi:serine/threonine-protein kinase HipA
VAVEVHAGGDVAGQLTRSEREPGVFLFGYDVRASAGQAVSLTMPVQRDQYDSMGELHPIFEMNLPEGALRQRIELMFSKALGEFDSLMLLQLLGRSQIGRLRYTAPGQAIDDVPQQDVEALIAAEGTQTYFQALLERFASHSGVSGMQPKVLVRALAAPVDRATERGATHIIKSFDAREYPELAANEYFCQRASALSGLPTARARLSADRSMLIVDRFDLVNGQYLGFEDFCVLFALRSSGRYLGSYENLAEHIGRFVRDPVKDLQQFFATLVLACVVGNGDAHLKNFGVLYDAPGENVRLAPVYDMVSTRRYVREDPLALTLNGTKAFPDREALIRFGRKHCGLSSKLVHTAFEAVEEGTRAALRELNAYAKEAAGFEAHAQGLREQFEMGLARTLASG